MEVLLYIGLLVGALIFCWQNITEYLEGDTSFSDSLEAISLSDWPTLVICLPTGIISDYFGANGQYALYGKSFFIDATVFENETKTVTLLENKAVKTQLGLELQLTEIYAPNWLWSQQCYKISSNAVDGNKDIDFQKFGVQLTFRTTQEHDLGYDELTGVTVISTSEKNAYGVVVNKWYDGMASQEKAKNGMKFFINEVTEYRKMEGSCSNQSYFECLADRLVNMDHQWNKKAHCQQWTLCSSLSLPPVGSHHIPICNRNDGSGYFDSADSCFLELVSELRASQDIHCQKACRVKGYKVDTEPLISTNPPKDFTIQYRFGSQKFSWNRRSERVFKTVKQEEWKFSTISFVGNVGGTIGMFIGFSFIGTYEWLLDTVYYKLMALIRFK